MAENSHRHKFTKIIIINPVIILTLSIVLPPLLANLREFEISEFLASTVRIRPRELTDIFPIYLRIFKNSEVIITKYVRIAYIQHISNIIVFHCQITFTPAHTNILKQFTSYQTYFICPNKVKISKK